MVIPKTIKIGGHTFDVQVTPLDDKCGDVSRNKGLIRVSSGLTKSNQAVTFLHEIFHVMNGELNETIIDSFSEQMYQVLHDNKLKF